MTDTGYKKNAQYYKFCLYGFLKNQRFFELYFLIILHQEKGLSLTQFGILLSIRLILRAILEIPSGFIADALGRKGTLLFAYAAYMLSFTTYYLAEDYLLLIVPTVLFGIGDAFRTGTHKAMIFKYLDLNNWKKYKVDYYGHTRAWSQTGSAVSSLIATALIWFRPEYNVVFLYSLIPYTLGFFILTTYPKSLESNDTKSLNWSKIFIEIGAVITSSLQAFRQKGNFGLTLNVASFTGFYFALKDYLQLLILGLVLALPSDYFDKYTDEQKEKILLGIAYSLLYFITASASGNSFRVSRLFPSLPAYLNTILISGFVMGALSGFFFLYNLQTAALIIFSAIFIVQNLQRPAGASLISERFEDKILASVLSVESQLGSLIGAILSLLTGFLADKIGVGKAIIIVSSLLIVVFPFFRIRNQKST